MADRGETPANPTRFAIFDRRTNNFLDEFATREEAESTLADWPGCEILDFGEFADFSATTEDGEQSRESRYMVDPAARLRVLLLRDEIPETAELTYSFSGGYERLDYRASENHGSIHYAGSYHPDGMCDGEHICSYCGSVHTY